MDEFDSLEDLSWLIVKAEEDEARVNETCIKEEEPEAEHDLADAAKRCASAVEEPPSERKRRRCRGSTGEGSCKEEVSESSIVVCLGCGRHKGISRCVFARENTLEWGWADGRGLLCRDCHTCWRTYYQNTHTLALFCVWLRQSENVLSFRPVLTAYWTLVHEGSGRITAQMISDRVVVVRFLAKVLGLATFDFTAFALEGTPKEDEGAASEAQTCTTIVAMDAAPPTTNSRLATKLETAACLAREILLQYCDDATWKAVKEASFGKAHNTFAAIVSEAVVEGQAKVHTDALAYVQGCLGNKGGLGGN
jgi:hypothetical protein